MTADYAPSRQVRRQGERKDAKEQEKAFSATDLAVLQRQHARVFRDLFQTFRKNRTEWDGSIDRDPGRGTVIIPTSDGSKPVIIMSPEPRKALTEHVAIVTLNAAQLDAVSYDPREKAKRDIEDVRLWSALSLARQNEGKALQTAIAYPLMRYGVAALWKPWRMPPEPTAEELAEFDEQTEGTSDPVKRAQAKREAYYEQWHREHQCFDWELINPLQLSWFPVTSKPRIVIQDSVIPIESLGDVEDWEGRKPAFNDGKVVWGEGVGSSDLYTQDLTTGPEVHFVRRAMLDEDGDWWCTEWIVSGSPGAGLSADNFKDGHVVRHYRSPYGKYCPYVIIPGGGEDTTKTDPDQRYYPSHMKPLIVYTDELNALTSLIVQLGLERAKNPNYIHLAGLTEHGRLALGQVLEPFGLQVTMEGTGGERAGVIKRVEVNNQEMPVLPDVRPLPDNVEPALLLRIGWLQDVGIPGVLPNRWLTGQQEASALQQGTLGLSQSQAAAVPYKQDVTATAEGIETLLQMELEAIAAWDRDMEEDSEKVYAVRAYSDLPAASRPPEDGQEVKLKASKLNHPHRLQVSVNDETAADQSLRESSAQAKYAGGWITKANALREMGSADPERSLEEIRAESMFERQWQQFAPVIDQQIQRLVLAMSGISVDPATAMGGAQPPADSAMQRQQANQGSSYPQPATSAPALSGPSGSSAGVGGELV